MSYLFHAIIYNNNSPYYDILFKSNNSKIALWYLIRLYYEKKRNDLFESFLFIKIKSIFNSIQDTFKYSYSKFLFQYQNLLSMLLYLLSNDIITLSSLHNWTLEFNTIYPTSPIIIQKRQIFNTCSRTFVENVQSLFKNNSIKPSSQNLFFNHKKIFSNTINHNLLSDNKIESALGNFKNKIIPTNNKIITYKPNQNLKLNKFIPSYYTDKSIMDKYQIWKDNDRFSKYTLNSLLLDNKKLVLKRKK